jgi:poly(3-hydroxybutyrate) depolymerase
MKLLLAALCALLLTGMARAPAQTLTDATINVYDPVLKPLGNHIIARHYLVWDGRANCAPGQTARLVVAFHGALGSAEGMAENFAPQGCYVVAYPSGSNKILLVKVDGNNLFWNPSTLYPLGWAETNGVNDGLFISSLVAKLKNDYGLTTAFAVGHSQGGLLTYHLACDKTLFAAIATIATTMADPSCSPATHVPNLHVHGTADTLMCWDTSGGGCAAWTPANTGVNWWQATGANHSLVLVEGGEHPWNTLSATGAVWSFLDSR